MNSWCTSLSQGWENWGILKRGLHLQGFCPTGLPQVKHWRENWCLMVFILLHQGTKQPCLFYWSKQEKQPLNNNQRLALCSKIFSHSHFHFHLFIQWFTFIIIIIVVVITAPPTPLLSSSPNLNMRGLKQTGTNQPVVRQSLSSHVVEQGLEHSHTGSRVQRLTIILQYHSQYSRQRD